MSGALAELTKYWNYEQSGELTPERTAEIMTEMLLKYYEDDCVTEEVPTPFWDEGQDVDDSEPPETQSWYGEVDDHTAEANEISFVENIGIWAITGFIAYSGQIGAAILFNTIAPRFVLAWHRGDVGEIWRVIVDAADAGTVDTTSAAVNDVVEFDVAVGDGTHEIMLVKVG